MAKQETEFNINMSEKEWESYFRKVDDEMVEWFGIEEIKRRNKIK